MEKQNFISSDTNVWIDYMVIDKLSLPFKLPITYLMNVDAVNDELLSPENLKKDLLAFGLKPVELTEDEFYYAVEISRQNPKLSKYDCSALAIARKRNIILLTGDKELRKMAEREKVEVIGTLGILDWLLKDNFITNDEYQSCINSFILNNGKIIRLPSNELNKRLKK